MQEKILQCLKMRRELKFKFFITLNFTAYYFTYVIQKSTHESGAFSGHTVYGYKNFLVSY